jgi:hypothetical protein
MGKGAVQGSFITPTEAFMKENGGKDKCKAKGRCTTLRGAWLIADSGEMTSLADREQFTMSPRKILKETTIMLVLII